MTPGTASAAGFNEFVVFGDSTLDTGYFAYTTSGSVPFDQQMQTALGQGLSGGWAGDGVMNTTLLAERFRLALTPSSNGGTNYANGGATTVVNPLSMVPDNVCTLSQIDIYLASVNGVANPNALYLIKTGDNDVTFVQYSTTPEWRAANPNYLSDGAESLAVKVAALQAAGARTIVVRNSYDSALFAGPGGDIPAINAEVYQRSRTLGVWEWAYLQAHGVRFIPADNDSLFRFVAHNPTLFGFTEHSVRSYHAQYFFPHTPAAFDAPGAAYQQSYLFIDGVHLTTAGQTIEADYTYSLLVAPSQISLLAESAVQNGWAHAATIQGQLDPEARRCRPCGRNVWTSAGAYSLTVNNAPGFPSESGTPFGGTVGVDYQTPDGFIFGVALTSGSQSPGFSTGGHFSQVDEAPSLYFGYVGKRLWGNAIVSYDLLQYEVNRSVPLGIFTDENHAHTTGQSLAFALRGGVDLGWGRLTTGPVAGVVLQEAHIGGFTETGTSGITALSFASQTRESLVTQLGWRAGLEFGDLRPFAEMNWNHECAGRDRTVTASLTTVGAPSYSMDAVPVASDWATTSVGAYYVFNKRMQLRGAASAMYLNPQMVTVGGEFSLNVGF
jgi:outer membrane lipase/esterase